MVIKKPTLKNNQEMPLLSMKFYLPLSLAQTHLRVCGLCCLKLRLLWAPLRIISAFVWCFISSHSTLKHVYFTLFCEHGTEAQQGYEMLLRLHCSQAQQADRRSEGLPEGWRKALCPSMHRTTPALRDAPHTKSWSNPQINLSYCI